MTGQYVIVIQTFGGRVVPLQAVQAVVDGAKDWGRFSPNVWFVASNLSASTWYERIRAVLNPEDNIVVHKLDLSDRAGWANQPIIEYFNRDHDVRPGT